MAEEKIAVKMKYTFNLNKINDLYEKNKKSLNFTKNEYLKLYNMLKNK